MKTNDAVSAPVVLGVNVAYTVHVRLAATEMPVQLLPLIAKSLAFALLIATPPMVKSEVPLFVTVTPIAELFTVAC